MGLLCVCQTLLGVAGEPRELTRFEEGYSFLVGGSVASNWPLFFLGKALATSSEEGHAPLNRVKKGLLPPSNAIGAAPLPSPPVDPPPRSSTRS
jgi:hypothetical protein